MSDERLFNEEELKLNERHRNSIATHRSNIQLAWGRFSSHPACKDTLSKCIEIYSGKSDNIALVNLMNMVSQQVKIHDLSKYSDDEFEAYRKNFFPIDEQEKEDNIQNFEKAKNHHYENNMHHWNWWANNSQKDNMPLPFVVEMAMDWIAVSMVHSESNAYEWYQKQNNIILGGKQKECIEILLTSFYSLFDVHGTLLDHLRK